MSEEDDMEVVGTVIPEVKIICPRLSETAPGCHRLPQAVYARSSESAIFTLS